MYFYLEKLIPFVFLVFCLFAFFAGRQIIVVLLECSVRIDGLEVENA